MDIAPYYSVHIPCSDNPTPWHAPPDFGTCVRGAWPTEAAAHAWAYRNIPGHSYSVKFYVRGVLVSTVAYGGPCTANASEIMGHTQGPMPAVSAFWLADGSAWDPAVLAHGDPDQPATCRGA